MKSKLLMWVVVFCWGCASSSAIQYPMGYEECSTSALCTVSGLVTATSSQGIWMGIMAFPADRCVSISLPDDVIQDLKTGGPRLMTVTGEVFGDPSFSHDVVRMSVDGREIGLGFCADWFVFVEGGGTGPGFHFPDGWQRFADLNVNEETPEVCFLGFDTS